jgi:hypothetical protein
MDTRKAQQVERLHAQISQDRYEIDPEAIAEAIVQRLLAGSGPGRATVGCEDPETV